MLNQEQIQSISAHSLSKLEAVRSLMKSYGSALVAYSGGVDSSFVLKIASDVLGQNAVGLTALSPALPPEEEQEAACLASLIGARHVTVRSEELANPDYARNPSNRCYFCKTELYDICEEKRSQLGLSVICDGFNADDLKGFGGVRVQFSFSVENGDPEGPAYGSKVLLFSPRGGIPNQNPLLNDVLLTRDGVTFGPGSVAPSAGTCDQATPIDLPLDLEIGLRPRLQNGSREQYVTTDYRGNQVSLTEQPRYSFYVTPGAEIGVDSADEPLDGVAPPDGLSRITGRAAGAKGTLWIVVRDGRGGESWANWCWQTIPAITPSSSRPASGHARSGLQ